MISDSSALYCHGYLATPVVEACQHRGLFKLLDIHEFRERAELIGQLGANEGYFEVALELLESLGWIEANGDGALRRTGKADGYREMGLTALYEIEPEQLISQEPHARLLREKIEIVFSRSGTQAFAASDLARGSIIVPLVVALKGVCSDLDRSDPVVSGTIRELFIQQGWLTVEKGGVTASGRALLERGAFKVAVSYRPVLQAIPELLFGDHARAFREIRDGGVLPAVLRRAQSDASVAAGLQQTIVEIFDRGPLEKQPGAIADVHWGDGAVLEGMIRTIRSRTTRGRHLAERPVRVIGVDEHGHNLAGLKQAGVKPEQRVLYLRRFVDSLLEADASQPVNEALGVLAADQPAHYVDREGRLLDATTVLSCRRQHLWNLAQGAGHSRLLILEAHATRSRFMSDPFEDCELPNDDWLDRLVHECPISADAFITLAASVGLFNDDAPKRYPRSSQPCRISLHSLTRRDYIVRHAAMADLDRLCELEELCWQHTRAPKTQIHSRLHDYPQGQFVLEREGKVLGVVYSQRIASTEALMTRTSADVHELHDASGPIVQLLAVNIDPQAQNASYGDQLLELMLQRCSLVSGIERVVGVTLCKSYDATGGRSFEEYIRLQGRSQDAVLAFHQSHGAEVVQSIPGYRPEDHANLRNGVLVAYDIINRESRRQRLETQEPVEGESQVGMSTIGQREIGRFVREEAAQLLGVSESELDIERPVMEMGLDSADLLKLQRLCEDRFGLRLESGFFFEHGSVRKVVDSLTIRLAAAPEKTDDSYAPRRPAGPAPERSDRADPGEIAATDIAIVGMACKLPGGIETPDQFWRVLVANDCVIGSFPTSRRAWPTSDDHPGIDQGGFVDDADAFDAAFFRMSPAEAQVTDPQQRMLLELAWTCLEDAGILPEALRGSNTGVFVGASNCDYSRLIQEAGIEIEAHHGVGNSLAILANRVSYFFDFCGPSLVVDTACSSSLVALHAAVQSLRSGECAAALVGGVNLICHPDLSIAYQRAGMLAHDGRCKVFDAKADGYVRSEGAVVLLLKLLRAAVADRDQIRAVIRGSAINHGGLAGGLTVPNPQKQSELLIAAWKDAGIAARNLTCIEAHGTGTPLGDPIELQGIQAAYAYGQHGEASLGAPCAIGSVKSNLGHLEPAAGITGLLKIVLSLQHRQLPASVNFTELNPRIRLAGTPFFVPIRLCEWDADEPRVAAVSSFGSGGTNAHVVVQEYSRSAPVAWVEGDCLFLLSAASQDRLRVYVRQLIEWLEREAGSVNFADAIFTWMVGRTAMKYRLAIKVKDHPDLLSKLKAWLAGKSDVPDVWSGQVAQGDSNLHRAWQTGSGRHLIDHALSERNLEPLGALWTSGIEIDWHKCYEEAGSGEGKPKVVSLPTYPFAKEKYWIDTSATRRGWAKGHTPSVAITGIPYQSPHPLLHANSSDLSRQSYSATFSGGEFFLADHQVRGDGRIAQKVLPGVAYLEMARAAIEYALPARSQSVVLELRNTVWLRPIVVTGETQVSIALMENDNGEIDYEIYSQDMDQEIVHCQGRAVFSNRTTPAGIDLAQLERQMTRGRLERSSVYGACDRMGLIYGPAFQGIDAIEQGRNQLLARMRLPRTLENGAGDYFLHPSLMDGALQAAVLLVDGGSEPSVQPRLPFALESLRIVSPCTLAMVAWVRYAPGSQPGSHVEKLDIDLCDVSGSVCAELRGLSLRTLNTAIATAAVPSKSGKCRLATPIWAASGREASGGAGKIEYAERHIVLCELPKVAVEKLEALVPNSLCLALQGEREETIARRYSDYTLTCFERIQAILQGKPQGGVLVQIIIAGHGEQTLLAGLSALLKTAALENPHLVGQVIMVTPQITAEELAGLLREEQTHEPNPVIRYEEGSRQILRWHEVQADADERAVELKDHGVYLITGGLGGLGSLFAQEILAQTRHASVVLTGRSALSTKQANFDELSLSTGLLSYRQVDLGDLDQVTRLVRDIQDEHQQLNGILHCAGMIADAFILKKDPSRFAEVLGPKVTGTYNLDQASQDVKLDFFALFSSFAGAIGNVGQADYAAANGFMDQYAAYRNSLVIAKRRHGRTRAINWPLWQSGGMKMDLASQELLQRTTGLQPMATATGMHAFHRSLALPYDQILVLVGDQSQIRRTFLGDPVPPAELHAEREVAVEEIDAESLAEKTQDYLRQQLSGVLRLPAHQIDPRAALEEYGIDSMLAMKLTNRLEETFGPLSKTLFFEYRTIRELTEYFVAQYSSQMAALLAATVNGMSEATPGAGQVLAPAPAKSISIRRLGRPRRAATGSATEFDAVAIIGLSGRYPEAVNIAAFWNNLRDGKDCIIEVPRERWDWRDYFSQDRDASGRHYSKWGGFISGVDEFEPQFFNISPRDAKYIDPQERLFLQHAWMAMEDAGYTRAGLQVPEQQDLPGQVGVYVGVMWSEYQLFGVEANSQDLRMAFAGNLASIANRVSYALNLHGPSMTLDSMCSSSLTAIHIACQDLRLGHTSVAIAGGVNVSIHPNKYLMLSLGQFISSDGHCQSFGEGGDGYIPGEGVGVVVLKRLAEAERDGDHIYGIIRGSALTHGGKTNGYTVPNPQAQSSAIGRALAASGTDARHVSYIEAHGTGTKLGDPIEIAALSRAFGQYTKDTEFWAIGSVKSNVGHCEAAAGMAGLTKVLLQMQHQKIVPSLHSAQLNPHIDFAKSPFVVNQSLRSWEQPVIDGRKVPRIAGISSFGAGGSNAHMIVEEYPVTAPAPMTVRPVAILLSARTVDQLQQKALDLLDFVREQLSGIDLVAMAYTLQVGREAMEERLGFVVSSAEQLVETLQSYVAGEQRIEDVHQGQVKRSREALSSFNTDAELQQTIDECVADGRLSQLLDLWVKGLGPDWSKLYGEARPRRMSLPTYPFAKERYWIDTAAGQRRAAAGPARAVIHPLLHTNTSDLNEQRFRSTFTGDEFFLAENGGQKVLPALACLEMARAAIEQVLPVRPESTLLELQNTVWAQPIVVSGIKQVSIALFSDDGQRIDYEIYSHDAGEEIVHCQGSAVLSREGPPARVEIERLEAQGQRLVRLRAGPVVDYVLHPTLMDSALKAAVGSIDGWPSALVLLRIVSPCTPEMVAWVRQSPGSQAADDALMFDIDLCDERGNVAVQMRGLNWQQVLQSGVELVIEEREPPAAPALLRREIVFLPIAQAVPAPVERRKRVAIALAPPGATASSPALSIGRARITLSSASLSVPLQGCPTPAASPVRLYDRGNGIFAIDVAASQSKDSIAHVLLALERVQKDASLKVLMLSGLEHCFPYGGRDEYNEAVTRTLFKRLVSFAYPVVAILHGGVIGAGFLAAALCDFMVCNEDARYGYTDPEHDYYPTTAEMILFGERFGESRASGFLYRSTQSTGRQLRENGWACPILPWAEVESHAQQLSWTLATKSQDALRLLKQHLTRQMVDLVDALTRVEEGKATTEEHNSSRDVLVIKYGMDAGKDLIAERTGEYKAIVLVIEDSEIPGDVVPDLQRLILESQIPVVAALTENASGNAWLVSQFCDASVYTKTGVYSSATVSQSLAQTAVAVFAHRVGGEAANEILLTGAEYSGADLQQHLGVSSVAKADQVLPAAVQLAESWAGLPRATLAAWKKQTAKTLQDKVRNLPSAAGWELEDESLFAAPEAIALRSRVVTAAVHPEGIVVVKMEDREARNMFSDALLEGLREAFAHIERVPAYKVVILTGYDNYFASGGTKESLLSVHEGKIKFTDIGIFDVALKCKLPVIAAMQGHGIGAGWSMGMFADIVLLSDESRYVSPYMNYGFTPGAGATYSLTDKMGLDLARESLLTARQYSGRELEERGLTLRVVPRITVDATAMALAKQIARLARGRLIGLKRLLRADAYQALEETYRLELAMHEKTFVGRPDTLVKIRNNFHQEIEPPSQVEPPQPVVERSDTPHDSEALPAVTAILKTLLADELQLRASELDESAQFVDLGLDSITGVTWIRKINQKYQTTIEATKVYSYPTLTQLSQYVQEEAAKRGTLPTQSATPAVVAPPALAKSTSPAKKVTTRPATERLISRRNRTASRFVVAATPPSQPIAVIGMAGQFPKAGDLEEFWQNIAQGRNCITEVPMSRWDVNAYYQPGDAVAGKTNSRWAGVLEEYDRFDPLFFNISPTEAESMDPQQRLFLQACWHSIENAGYDAQMLSGSKCGVFAGCATTGDYHQSSRQHQLSAQGFTGSATSILAGRISYFLNLQGPSVSIDTACSSALVALAQACDSLISGSSDLALAGGVYVMAGPEMHIKASQTGMLSPEGKCFTFDQRADGFVPGEGVGVVLLKRLADAERDRDIIYGVLQGWGVNQDGKTNGITAPNPQSQTRLEQDVYTKYKIDPENIQLIEAHGTGTKLGDPIEVEGLKEAFKNYNWKKDYCALGSVKSNIGHCLAAAGIAGLLKVVLALEHKQLPPTINFERLNEHIDLNDTPFYINNRLQDWNLNGAKRRQAAISSFGFGGTNAHIVIGEYQPRAEVKQRVSAARPSTKVIVPLSARTAEQLMQKARDLLGVIRRDVPSADLVEVAYTLQVGRAAMDERLGFVVSSLEQLAEKLQAYVQGEEGIDEAHRGRVARNKESTSIISLDDDMKETIVTKWIAGGKLSKVLNLWVSGLELDWNQLYGEDKPQRISLPLYPFAKERYWIDAVAGGRGAGGGAPAAALHPLLHKNTSDLGEQRYSSTFTGEESFLADHRVRMDGGSIKKMLPGVAYLEMVRAAIDHAWPARSESTVLELYDTVWLQPVVVERHAEVSIALFTVDDDSVDYEIYSTQGGQRTVHCQGQAAFGRQPPPAGLDLEQLRSEMEQGRLDADEVYAMLAAMGLHYGRSHQGITAIHLGNRQLLAELRLPEVAEASQRDYVLHPSLMDSALQASIGLIAERNYVSGKPAVPFAVESVRIVSACTREMSAWLRYSEVGKADGFKLDIDLCDGQGNVCVQMRGFALRIMEGEGKADRRGIGDEARPTIKKDSSFDETFYERVLEDVLSGEVSVEEAAALG